MMFIEQFSAYKNYKTKVMANLNHLLLCKIKSLVPISQESTEGCFPLAVNQESQSYKN